jgi:translation initiation factor 1 (eIF-1/SUI1)
LSLDKRFKKNLSGRFGKYSFEVGVLEDSVHRDPKRGARGQGGQDVISAYAGGPIRKAGRSGAKTVTEVSKANSERLGFNYLTEPFKKKTSDIIKFSNEFFKMAFGKSEKKRCENLLQAIVRNPILRGDYGSNSALTQKIKGFDRGMIDTAQLFKALKAKCTIRGGK